MKERGLLLTKDNRQLSRDGDKTATRRVIVPQPPATWTKVECHTELFSDGMGVFFEGYNECGERYWWPGNHEPHTANPCHIHPRYAVGDHLYMLEPYEIYAVYDKHSVYVRYPDNGSCNIIELTDLERARFDARKKPNAPTSSMFMYKSLARTWFEVTGVKVERLQDITHCDILREGVNSEVEPKADYPDNIKKAWINLWDSINKKRGYGWEVNPWVWAYEYKRLEKL